MASLRPSGANSAPHARQIICATLGMLAFCAAPISAQQAVSDSPTLHGRIEAAAKMLQNDPRLKRLTEQHLIDRVEFVAANTLVLLLPAPIMTTRPASSPCVTRRRSTSPSSIAPTSSRRRRLRRRAAKKNRGEIDVGGRCSVSQSAEEEMLRNPPCLHVGAARRDNQRKSRCSVHRRLQSADLDLFAANAGSPTRAC
jgi:hypothetical protein